MVGAREVDLGRSCPARRSSCDHRAGQLERIGAIGRLPSVSGWPRRLASARGGAALRTPSGRSTCDLYRLLLGTCQLLVTTGPGAPLAPNVFSVTWTRAGASPISSSSEPSALVSGFAPPCS